MLNSCLSPDLNWRNLEIQHWVAAGNFYLPLWTLAQNLWPAHKHFPEAFHLWSSGQTGLSSRWIPAGGSVAEQAQWPRASPERLTPAGCRVEAGTSSSSVRAWSPWRSFLMWRSPPRSDWTPPPGHSSAGKLPLGGKNKNKKKVRFCCGFYHKPVCSKSQLPTWLLLLLVQTGGRVMVLFRRLNNNEGSSIKGVVSRLGGERKGQTI